MVEYLGSGDPRRSLPLLWGKVERGTRGPKGSLDVETIVQVAIELADRDGLDAVSMRRVAETFGRSAMSLYSYVPSKAELVDLMLDRCLAELELDAPGPDGWRCSAERLARQLWEFYERHPWLLLVSSVRPAHGPNEMDALEGQVRVFDGLGLSGRDTLRMVVLLHGFVRNRARERMDARRAVEVTGLDDDTFWNQRADLLNSVSLEQWPTRYPTITKLQLEEQAFDQPWEGERDGGYAENVAADTFEVGLQWLLDGFQHHIDGVRAST